MKPEKVKVRVRLQPRAELKNKVDSVLYGDAELYERRMVVDDCVGYLS